MKDVEVSYVIEASPEEIERRLSPERIVEYMGYVIRDARRTGKTEIVSARKADVELELEFREHRRGYEFNQYGTTGPYREMRAGLWVEAAADVTETRPASRVTARISYTFGTVFSFLVDRLARRTVKTELQQLLSNLARDVVNGGRAGSGEGEGRSNSRENLDGDP